jgi:ribosomal protein S27AE
LGQLLRDEINELKRGRAMDACLRKNSEPSTMKDTSAAKAALERIRLAMKGGAPADPQDVDTLVGYFVESEKTLFGAVDLLRTAQDDSRSKQIGKAQKLLEELLPPHDSQPSREAIEVTSIRSKPTMCLNCKFTVEMAHLAEPEPRWLCPQCGHVYLDKHWRIPAADPQSGQLQG